MYAVKVLAPVDVSRLQSNQHEFNGAAKFRRVLGEPSGKVDVRASVVELDHDDLARPASRAQTWMTWYNAREGNPRRAAEFRLYYRPDIDGVVGRANPGDILVLLRVPSPARHHIAVVMAVARRDSTAARSVSWVFDSDVATGPQFSDSVPVLRLPSGSVAAADALSLALGAPLDVRSSTLDVDSPDERIGARFDREFQDLISTLSSENQAALESHVSKPELSFLESRVRNGEIRDSGVGILRRAVVDELDRAGIRHVTALDRDEAGLLIESSAGAVWDHLECWPLVDSVLLGRMARKRFPRYLLTLQTGLGHDVLRELDRAACTLVVPEQLRGAYMGCSQSGLLSVTEWLDRYSVKAG